MIPGTFRWNSSGFGIVVDGSPSRDLFFPWASVEAIYVVRLGENFGLIVHGGPSGIISSSQSTHEIGILDLEAGRTFRGVWTFYRHMQRLPVGEEIENAKRGSFDGQKETNFDRLFGPKLGFALALLAMVALASLIVKVI
jgi:hypothetical protein